VTPDVVADIGNTRVKWGRCGPDGLGEVVSLPEDPDAWAAQLGAWNPSGRPWSWVLAGVRPQRCRWLQDWLESQDQCVVVLNRVAQLPLVVRLERPDAVGIDRLLDAVAALPRLAPDVPAVLVDAGSAVTVDWLDESHAFCGGTIFPGLGLMARALNDHTALLPLVEVDDPQPSLPAPDTLGAMKSGILHAVAGGIERIVHGYQDRCDGRARVFLTGGDSGLLLQALSPSLNVEHWPEQTLSGIFHSARGLT
jgi:type III pantothenate kinase